VIRDLLRPAGSHPAERGPRPPLRLPAPAVAPSGGRNPVVSAPPDRPCNRSWLSPPTVLPPSPQTSLLHRYPPRPPADCAPSAARGPSREAATAARHGWPATRSVRRDDRSAPVPVPRVSDRHRPGPAPWRGGCPAAAGPGVDRRRRPQPGAGAPQDAPPAPHTAAPPADGGRPPGPGRPPSASVHLRPRLTRPPRPAQTPAVTSGTRGGRGGGRRGTKGAPRVPVHRRGKLDGVPTSLPDPARGCE
jgi:hypothetical protein